MLSYEPYLNFVSKRPIKYELIISNYHTFNAIIQPCKICDESFKKFIAKGSGSYTHLFRTKAINKIDRLMNTYCYQCPLKSHNRKTEGKTQAHHFALMSVQ